MRCLGLLLLSLYLFGCRGSDDPIKRSQTEHSLTTLVGYIDGMSRYRKVEVRNPADVAGLIESELGASTARLFGCVDTSSDTVVDRWNRDVIVLHDDGEFLGLGSAGADGIWEGGKGDDIMVLLSKTPDS